MFNTRQRGIYFSPAGFVSPDETFQQHESSAEDVNAQLKKNNLSLQFVHA